MKRLTLPLVACMMMLATGCQRERQPATDEPMMPKDPHSFAQPSDARVTHLHWKAVVDFDTHRLHATASWTIEATPDADIILLDTKGLAIDSVTRNDGQPASYKLSAPDTLLGQGLAVLLTPDTRTIHIHYHTSPEAEALQWLSPAQTAGKQQPFLFTQSQAILARSWVPCQDSPQVRFTYDAEVTVPPQLMALMSASNPQHKNDSGRYTFHMAQPIPSYLLALTVGDIVFQPVSTRAGVYAEPSMIDTATWEFADLEKMIAGAEDLYGAYPWERYDVIVLPPSFPFGGMENPRLTFATPTILAGDRSLTSLIAHELAHSWSGNLVTNATWNDFWLNEGFTVYFEHRIMEKLYGRDYAEMLSQLALQDLYETIESLRKDNQYADTRLKLNLENRNPDDGVTDIAYNKGYFFLRWMEESYGRDKFDQFVRDYFQANAFRAMDTERFIPYTQQYYRQKFNIDIPEKVFNAWIYTEGLPDDCPKPASGRFTQVIEALATWKTTGDLPPAAKQWSTHEWLHFLKNLPDNLSTADMIKLDATAHFTASGNAEITTSWLVHAIRHQYTPAYARLESFLIHTGRRKFLSPLYYELIKTPEGRKMAIDIYRKARPNYHYVATSTFDGVLGM